MTKTSKILATIGIIITKEALNYQNKINWLEKNEDNTSYRTIK